MAFAQVVETSKAGTGGGATSDAIDTTGATLIVCAVSWYGGAGNAEPADVTDSKSNTWTLLTSRKGTGTQWAGTVFSYCVNPTVGSSHTFSSTEAGSYANIHVYCFSGVDTASPFDQETGAGGGAVTNVSTGSLTPANDDSLLVTSMGQYNSTGAVSVNGGFTIDTDAPTIPSSSGVHVGGAMAYLIQTTAAAANPNWDWTDSAAGAAALAIFKADAGSGTIEVRSSEVHSFAVTRSNTY